MRYDTRAARRREETRDGAGSVRREPIELAPIELAPIDLAPEEVCVRTGRLLDRRAAARRTPAR